MWGLFLSLFLLSVTATVKENAEYYASWCGSGLEYLDDNKCAKVFPTTSTRNLKCAASMSSSSGSLPPGFAPDAPFTQIRPESLDGVVTNGADACVILTRRVARGISRNQAYLDSPPLLQLFNKYFCTPQGQAYETWSSSKIFAMANAGSTLRGREPADACPAGVMGMDAVTTGKASPTSPLGDLATIVCSYDHTAGYTSNGLSSYFHDLGWRTTIHDLVQSDWLAGTGTTITLGGNYGEPSPSDLGFRLTASGSTTMCNAVAKPVSSQPTYENSLTSLAAAELTRRLVLHADVAPSLRWPFLEDEDVANIVQGANVSALFPSQVFGGMSADTSIFLQSWLNMSQVETSSEGRWRIYSKLGAGFSSSRQVGEIVNNVYACLPGYLGGLEATIHVRGSVPKDTGLVAVESIVHEAMGMIVTAISDGRIA